MRHPKQIMRPDLSGCEKLTPVKANEIHLGNTHSVISPDRLAEASAAGNNRQTT